jgi:hypothetical protein
MRKVQTAAINLVCWHQLLMLRSPCGLSAEQTPPELLQASYQLSAPP